MVKSEKVETDSKFKKSVEGELCDRVTESNEELSSFKTHSEEYHRIVASTFILTIYTCS